MAYSMSESDEESLLQSLALLEEEHQELNDILGNEKQLALFDEITIQRLKKRKLLLKDSIKKIRSILYPDIIA